MTVEIVTNNHWRKVIPWYELSLTERDQFGYLDWQAIEAGNAYAEFFQYNGELYDLNDMEAGLGNAPRPEWLKGWDNYISDSFFSGIVVKYNEDASEVIVGTYYAK